MQTYKFAHFTFNLLLVYIGKCKKSLLNDIQQWFQLNGLFWSIYVIISGFGI